MVTWVWSCECFVSVHVLFVWRRAWRIASYFGGDFVSYVCSEGQQQENVAWRWQWPETGAWLSCFFSQEWRYLSLCTNLSWWSDPCLFCSLHTTDTFPWEEQVISQPVSGFSSWMRLSGSSWRLSEPEWLTVGSFIAAARETPLMTGCTTGKWNRAWRGEVISLWPGAVYSSVALLFLCEHTFWRLNSVRTLFLFHGHQKLMSC